MQNVSQESSTDNPKLDKVNVQHDIGNSSTPHSTSNSSPAKSETETFSEHKRFMSDFSEEEEDSVSEVESFMIDQEFDEDPAAKFLLNTEEDRAVDPETQARLEALLQAAGISQLAAKDGKNLADPEVLRRLTSSVSCALDEAAAALTRMRTDNPRSQPEKTSLVEACTDGDVGTVRKLLTEGRSVHETSEEGESLLSLACSAGYFELAQVLLAMHANVEDRGIKGECTPLMEAASNGHLDIVRLLVAHGADVNAQSTTGNTPLMHGCAGGHTEVVEFLLEHGANVEDHNENGHTPLMEAASAGHVGLAKILLKHGAGINTHSNEFKESALTLACYKGHLDMVRFLLEAGADQEHKTDEMHTALMEASMDGHVEVARLLLDSGAQVNMPTDSFESPLTLAACGGHVDLAMLLIERGANIEEVNDEGYTPLMEAAREGHEEMVHLLLGQGANINAQTDETQETALTLACCGGFTDVADILLKGGANIELGASTPLMEAAQEGHLDLVKFLLQNGANVQAQTQTGDTALTYACENGHTDVADLLLQFGADLEHESEGGRTPLMKACRAGHLCTVQFLISKGANVRRTTTNNDHTPLSLACAGGHLAVVELLLAHNADPNHKLKDNSTMLIEAAKGGHTNVVQLLLDYPHSVAMNQHQQGSTAATNLSMLPGQVGSRESPLPVVGTIPTANNLPPQPINFFQQPAGAVLQEVPEAVRIITQDETGSPSTDISKQQLAASSRTSESQPIKSTIKKTALPRSRSTGTVFDGNLTSAEASQVRTQPSQPLPIDFDEEVFSTSAAMEFLNKEDHNGTLLDFIKNRKKHYGVIDDGTTQKQQILEELHKVERELHGKQQAQNHPFQYSIPQDQNAPNTLPPMLNIDIAIQQGVTQGAQAQQALAAQQGSTLKLAVSGDQAAAAGGVPNFNNQAQPAFYFPALSSAAATANVTTTIAANQTNVKFQNVVAHTEVSQNTAICDRPKAKPVSKKEGKNARKQNQQYQPNIYNQQQQLASQIFSEAPMNIQDVTGIDFESIEQLREKTDPNFLTASLLQLQNAAVLKDPSVQPYPGPLDEYAALAAQQDLPTQADLSRVEYFPVPANTTPVPTHVLYPYEQYLAATGIHDKNESSAIYQAGYQAGINDMQQHLACKTASSDTLTTTSTVVPTGVAAAPATQFIKTTQPTTVQPAQVQSPPCSHATTIPVQTPAHSAHVQVPCSQHQQQIVHQQQQIQPATTQVQAATQTLQTNDQKNQNKAKVIVGENVKVKKGRIVRHQNQAQLGGFQQNQNFPIDTNSAITQYTSCVNQQQCANSVPIVPTPCMDVDSQTESNHDTALTLACAGGHEELVELLLNRGADIEHRDKKGFTPLILAATAGHEKVVEILLNHNADIEAQSERTKDTPLSLACSGGRIESVELLLSRNANKEHRNVSDYTPLSLAASGGYVNIIKLLLSHGAEINSRTGSKLGISPLMLAAMNGHTAAVKLLLDMGSDINAQIETNRNTALTLACFQGRHEVVSLLLDRKANVEHRAKTGLTPLMEAASGGYVDVGRVLLDKGADVNAAPVPSSRDTALTIAADKGHVRFVELLLCRGALVEVKNKKGNSPLWLAANGGHLAVVELLYNIDGDIDSQDNRKVSCLMAAFRKGHVKVVKWMVHHVAQFPSDQEMIRYIATISDKELLEKCQECVKIIRAAKETQAAKANKNASILLEELDKEKNMQVSKKLAAARRRERKKKKKLEKKEERRKLLEENKKNENYDEKDKKDDDAQDDDDDDDDADDANDIVEPMADSPRNGDKEEGDSGIDANSQGSCSSNDIKSKEKRKEKKKKKGAANAKVPVSNAPKASSSKAPSTYPEPVIESPVPEKRVEKTVESKSKPQSARKSLIFESSTSRNPAERDDFEATGSEVYVPTSKSKKAHHDDAPVSSKSTTSPKQPSKREEGWKEVVRKSSVQTVATNETGVKKVSVPLNAISRVIGRGGSNINAIRAATGAHIEVEKQCKGQGERIITIKGSPEATKHAHSLIATLIKDPDADILQIIPKSTKPPPAAAPTTLWDKTQIGTKKATGKVQAAAAQAPPPPAPPKAVTPAPPPAPVAPRQVTSTTVNKTRTNSTVITNRNTAPRLIAQAEKNAAAAAISSASNNTRTMMAHISSAPARPTAKAAAAGNVGQTFAAKLTETVTSINQLSISTSAHPIAPQKSRTVLGVPPASAAPISPQAPPPPANNVPASPKHNRPAPTASAPPNMQHYQSPGKNAMFGPPTSHAPPSSGLGGEVIRSGPGGRSTTPNIHQHAMNTASDEAHSGKHTANSVAMPGGYSLFNSGDQPMWRIENESQKPVNFAAVTGAGSNSQNVAQPKFIDQEPLPLQVDASKAPGYRGGAVCSPVSSKTSSNSTTPPNIPPFGAYHDPPKSHNIPPPIGMNVISRPQAHQSSSDLSSNNFYHTDIFKQGSSTSIPHSLNMSKDTSHLMQTFHQNQQPTRNAMSFQQQQPVSMSRLNPKAPDFSSSSFSNMNKPNNQLFNGFPSQIGGGNNNNPYAMNKDPYRNNMSQGNPPPLALLQQTELISSQLSGMAAGLTIHSLARATGSDIMENNADLAGIINNSPHMSPNIPQAHLMAGDFMDDRKPPQPIGTERARSKNYNPLMEGSNLGSNNWMYGNESKNSRWPGNNMDSRFSMSRGGLYNEGPPMMEQYQRGLHMDDSHNIGQTYILPQQMGNLGNHDFVPVPPVPWDTASRQNLMDDKPVWATMSEWKP